MLHLLYYIEYMILKYKLCLLAIVWSLAASTQNRSDYTWVNGTNYTDSLDGTEGSIIDFNYQPPKISYQPIFPAKALGNSIAAISDRYTGELLFYSNGCVVYNRNHQLMMNGDDLNPGKYRDHYCDTGGEPLWYPQGMGMIVLPDPAYGQGYYMFHQAHDFPEEGGVVNDRLLYSYIDMALNDGDGAVTDKNIIIAENGDYADGMVTAVKHSNKIHWWILQLNNETNEYTRILLDDNGFIIDGYQTIGDSIGAHDAQAMFSPDGSLYAWFSEEKGLHLFDFDRSTGLLSNHRSLNIAPNLSVGGLCFAPGSHYLYVLFRSKIYQIDVWEDDLINAYVLVDKLLIPPNSGLQNSFLFGMLGPDCRIYITARNSTQYYTVIENPDQKGKECNVSQLEFKLPWYKFIGAIPNFPHFRIDEEMPCDPGVSSVAPLPTIEDIVTLAPNPTMDILTVRSKLTGTLRIIDISGKILLQDIQKIDQKVDIDIATLESGIYFLQLQNDVQHTKMMKFIKL